MEQPVKIPTGQDGSFPLKIAFGADKAEFKPTEEGAILLLPIPECGNNPSIIFKARSSRSKSNRSWSVLELPSLDAYLAVCLQPVQNSLESVTLNCYRDLFSACGEKFLYRIWNFVPFINQIQKGLENYHAFCVGRSNAFHEKYGEVPETFMPSASALGCPGETFISLALFGSEKCCHLENSLQVPAYRYPSLYGPRPPSFSRGTVVHRYHPPIFISGTSSVRGHQTIGKGDLFAQVRETITNLKSIEESALEIEGIHFAGDSVKVYTVYLRDPSRRSAVEPILQTDLFDKDNVVFWLKADICRSELELEIELAILPRLSSSSFRRHASR